MISVTKKEYTRDYPDWVKRCPLCELEEIDSIINLESDNLNRVHFAIGKKCRVELSKKLLRPTS